MDIPVVKFRFQQLATLKTYNPVRMHGTMVYLPLFTYYVRKNRVLITHINLDLRLFDAWKKSKNISQMVVFHGDESHGTLAVKNHQKETNRMQAALAQHYLQ